MGRKVQPKDRVGVRYVQGPPKRIALTLYRVGGEPVTVNLSTLAGRELALTIFDRVDAAEADKVALRGTSAAAKRPKRARPKTKSGAVARRPSRLKRVEQAALAVAGLDRARLPREAREVVDALMSELGIAPAAAVLAP